MNRYLVILLVVTFTIVSLSPAISHADLFSQTIGDDDNFGGWPGEPPIYGWDTRSTEEINATNGAQFTDISNDSYQRTFTFDFGTPITDIIQSTLEVRVHDLEDDDSGFGYPPEHVDIQIDINGFDVPGAFDDLCFSGTSAVVTFDLLDLLGVDALGTIFAGGQITVQFLNAGTYQEYYAIDWVSLSVEEPSPDSGTMCRGLADYDSDVDADDVEEFLKHFGRFEFNNPCPPDGPAPVAKTGQTTSHATGDDGDHERGVAWPNPRFTDNGDGTVTDNLTGLIWLKNANCFGAPTWEEAVSDCIGVEDGSCGLTDGSSAGDWRLPSLFELESLRAMQYENPCLSDTTGSSQWTEGNPFTNLQIFGYWSSTTDATWSPAAWVVGMDDCREAVGSKHEGVFYYYVWPVRGGH